jgi:hypothetical protein
VNVPDVKRPMRDLAPVTSQNLWTGSLPYLLDEATTTLDRSILEMNLAAVITRSFILSMSRTKRPSGLTL